MIIGIDLATVNCGVCFFKSPDNYSFSTIGLENLEMETVLKFSEALKKMVHDQTVYVDFSFNEIFLPNKRKHIAIKYFLAGVIFTSAFDTQFITPARLRKFYNMSSKTTKVQIQNTIVPAEILSKRNSHEIDAWLLAAMGYEQIMTDCETL